MDFAGKARRLERKITRAVDAAMTEFIGQSDTAPIEIVHSVLARAEDEIEEVGRGQRVFPFNRVRVLVAAAAHDTRTRARVGAVIDGPPTLSERLSERLRAAGCAPGPIATELVYVPERREDWSDPAFHVEFERVEAAAPPPEAPAPLPAEATRIKLTVAKGSASQRVYIFGGGRIDIGRRAEVLDQRQRLIRTNHVAFADDGPEPNSSVSRRHAHIEYSAADRAYRVWDDGSAQGTSIVRQGRTIKVAAGARGARLESGDELVLGHARLRVAFEAAPRGPSSS